MIIVPQKTDSSKIFIIKMVDHIVTDALNYLHATSMLQDRDWKENPVPRAFTSRSQRLTTWQVFYKWFELIGNLTAYGKKQDAIKRVGKGEPSSEYSYSVSGPIDLKILKQKSKQLDVTINELFVGARG